MTNDFQYTSNAGGTSATEVRSNGSSTTIMNDSRTPERVTAREMDGNHHVRAMMTADASTNTVTLDRFDSNGQLVGHRTLVGPEADRMVKAWNDAKTNGVSATEFAGLKSTEMSTAQAVDARGTGPKGYGR